MNKGIMFFLGLLIGIMICVSLNYVDKKLIKSAHATAMENEIMSRVDTVYVETLPVTKKAVVETKPEAPPVEEVAKIKKVEEDPVEDEVSIYDTEFSFESEEQDEVFLDQMLQSKIVKAVLHPLEQQEGKTTQSFFHIFELQQWSTPIKNKLTYSRYQNLVKVKGMEINNAKVVFWNETFYLEVKNRYYPIPENDNFEKLNAVKIP